MVRNAPETMEWGVAPPAYSNKQKAKGEKSMRLTKVDPKEVDFYRKGHKPTKLQAVISEFEAMETPVAKVEWEGEYKHVGSAYNSLKESVRRQQKQSQIKPRILGGNLYLLNVSLYEKENR